MFHDNTFLLLRHDDEDMFSALFFTNYPYPYTNIDLGDAGRKVDDIRGCAPLIRSCAFRDASLIG